MKKKEQKRLQDETSGLVSGLKLRGRERERESQRERDRKRQRKQDGDRQSKRGRRTAKAENN